MECREPKLIWPHRSIEWIDNPANEEKAMLVPCGKCIACLMNKRLDWSLRLGHEHRVSKSAHFVTLTYDQKHIRTDQSLCKRDMQLYLKRLRKKDELSRIRYYAVGEYGSRTGRPHYHMLLFNSIEEHIRSAWVDSKGNSIGLVHVGKVTSASIAYCTKYIVQPMGEILDGRERPFATMSRAYGIGGHYLSDEMVKWHRENDANYTPLPDNGKGRLPRFYKDKIWFRESDKRRIHSNALTLVLGNQIKERAYYEKTYPGRGEQYRLEALDAVLQRVASRIKHSQTF